MGICAFFYYVKLIQCSGVPYIYGQLEEGVKLIQCSGVP